jgi:hypothetical protein
VTDEFTKALPCNAFCHLLNMIMGWQDPLHLVNEGL